MDQWFRFLLATLAVWRITHLLVHEDGPWDLGARLREQLGPSFWGRLMDCFKCLSVWIAVPFAWFVGGGWIQELVVWLALSGAAILLEGRSRGNPCSWKEESKMGCCGNRRTQAAQPKVTQSRVVQPRPVQPRAVQTPVPRRYPAQQSLTSSQGRLVRLAYAGDRSFRVSGAYSGRTYAFSPQHREQWVDGRDSKGLLRTGLFRLA